MASTPSVCVGVDGSDGARDALALGRRLAERLAAPLVAVHVRSPDSRHPLMGDVDAELRTVDHESGADGLKAFSETEPTQLIVVGSSSRTGLGRVFPGETATRLFASVSVAVAVAPAGYADRSDTLSTIGCGHDGGDSARAALRWATELCAAAPGSSLEVIAVTPHLAFGGATVTPLPSMSAQEALRREVDRDLEAIESGSSLEIRGVRLEGDPVELLVGESGRLDLLVLGSRGRGPVRSVLLGSVSAEVVRRASCPVAVIPRVD